MRKKKHEHSTNKMILTNLSFVT
uniref:Uncharacterized protein n=1 Tax=Anguilla anguilla TaxID=7936 RepID=A0A0E9S275_ANGAN